MHQFLWWPNTRFSSLCRIINRFVFQSTDWSSVPLQPKKSLLHDALQMIDHSLLNDSLKMTAARLSRKCRCYEKVMWSRAFKQTRAIKTFGVVATQRRQDGRRNLGTSHANQSNTNLYNTSTRAAVFSSLFHYLRSTKSVVQGPTDNLVTLLIDKIVEIVD